MEEGDTVPVLVKEHQEVEGGWFTLFVLSLFLLRCGGAELWGSPRARAALREWQEGKEGPHSAPQSGAEKWFVELVTSGCSSKNRFPCTGVSSSPEFETLARADLAGDLTLKIPFEVCEASGLPGAFRKPFTSHLLSWDEFPARAFGCLPVEFCEESPSVPTRDSHHLCWGSGRG